MLFSADPPVNLKMLPRVLLVLVTLLFMLDSALINAQSRRSEWYCWGTMQRGAGLT
jgi:hypothetical protein